MKNLFVIDDEHLICDALSFNFENRYTVFKMSNLYEYNENMQEYVPDIVLLDLKFGDINGLELLKDINRRCPQAKVIIMTAYGTIDTAVEAIKSGAFDYILKPFEIETINDVVKEADSYQELQKKINITEDPTSSEFGVVGNSKSMREVYNRIEKIKDKNVNVLIQGESGTGKEYVARAIHYKSNRKDFPFIVVNCAAMPSNLIESELFGYEKGAFTGAYKSKKGAFELADSGTIFLDEIGELDLLCQAKLLRVIQNREIIPLGSVSVRKIDVRIVAATNRDLKKETENGTFRLDLYYRLNVFPIMVPPLRERKEDIRDLVKTFINRANILYGLNIESVTNSALKILTEREYEGNIRELENIVNRACIMCTGSTLSEEYLSDLDSSEEEESTYNNIIPVKIGSRLEQIEKEVILKTLGFVNGNKSRAARLLGISERNIHYKLKEYENEK